MLLLLQTWPRSVLLGQLLHFAMFLRATLACLAHPHFLTAAGFHALPVWIVPKFLFLSIRNRVELMIVAWKFLLIVVDCSTKRSTRERRPLCGRNVRSSLKVCSMLQPSVQGRLFLSADLLHPQKNHWVLWRRSWRLCSIVRNQFRLQAGPKGWKRSIRPPFLHEWSTPHLSPTTIATWNLRLPHESTDSSSRSMKRRCISRM